MCAAVGFGTVIGLKDGIGKASEFFAGYAQILHCTNVALSLNFCQYIPTVKLLSLCSAIAHGNR